MSCPAEPGLPKSPSGAEAFDRLCGGTGRSFHVIAFLPAACWMAGQPVMNDLCSSATAFQPVLHRAVGNGICMAP